MNNPCYHAVRTVKLRVCAVLSFSYIDAVVEWRMLKRVDELAHIVPGYPLGVVLQCLHKPVQVPKHVYRQDVIRPPTELAVYELLDLFRCIPAPRFTPLEILWFEDALVAIDKNPDVFLHLQLSVNTQHLTSSTNAVRTWSGGGS